MNSKHGALLVAGDYGASDESDCESVEPVNSLNNYDANKTKFLKNCQHEETNKTQGKKRRVKCRVRLENFNPP